jgi:energy-coupling factor transporter ATP-binding protein EcfA2
MFLNHFDPSDISPDVMVDREDDVAWLRENFERYFDAIENHTLTVDARRIVCVTGDKGIGKSILAAKVIQQLRRKYSASTLFVSVDCRSANGARGVIGSIASGLLHEIASFAPVAAAGGKPFPDWIQDLAYVLSNVAHADTASRKTIHQQLSVKKSTLKLGGQQMLRALKAEFDISLEREKREIDALETAVTFDVDRLLLLTAKLFEDLRNAGMRVFLLVDNVDELQHEYWDEDARNHTQATVKSVLRLTEAPIAMLLCMRTYFQSILPRAVGLPRQLGPLPEARLLEIVEHRIGLDAEHVQLAMRSDAARAVILELARRATTPLALLTWVKWVAESKPGFADPIGAHALTWRGARYVDFAKVIQATLKLFATKRAAGEDSVTREELLEAIGNNEHGFRYLQTTELILPRDFWNPTHFVLDPSAAWIVELRLRDAGQRAGAHGGHSEGASWGAELVDSPAQGGV